MIYQVIDAGDECLRLWTGTAATAIQHQADLGERGREVSVADHKGRRLSLSDLYECAARENERHAVASLTSFRRLMDARNT